jgi:hypothetical protein
LLRLPALGDNAAMEAEPPKRKRRWFQFSLRTLFVVVATLAVECAVCLPMLREWQKSQQREFAKRQVVKQAIHWLSQHQRANSRWSLAASTNLQDPLAFSPTPEATGIAGPASSRKK